MNETFIFILSTVSIISAIIIYLAIKNAEKIDDDDYSSNKFEPRKMTDLSKGKLGVDPVEKPKRPYKKRRKKKKPTVAENATTEKRPVGRPRKNIQ
jgi:hypothetical protein